MEWLVKSINDGKDFKIAKNVKNNEDVIMLLKDTKVFKEYNFLL